MQVSELVRVTAVPLATLKYYLREGLLPAGRKVTARSRDYGPAHVRRLHLLRVLREVGGLPVSRLKELVDAVDDDATPLHLLFARANDAIAASSPAAVAGGDEPPSPRSAGQVRALLDRAGWSRARADSVDVTALGHLLDRLEGSGTYGVDARVLQAYAEAADRLARAEIASLPDVDEADRSAQLERMVVGTVVFGEVLTVLRRLAEEHHSAERFGVT